MAHHKRRRPKHQRAGCLHCKPHKDERAPKSPRPGSGSDRRMRAAEAAIREALASRASLA